MFNVAWVMVVVVGGAVRVKLTNCTIPSSQTVKSDPTQPWKIEHDAVQGSSLVDHSGASAA